MNDLLHVVILPCCSVLSDDPYWEILSSPIQYASVGTNITLLSQYASLSQGYGNDGPEISFEVLVFYFSFDLISTVLIQYSEKFLYQWEYRFTVNSSSQGIYSFSGNKPNIQKAYDFC